VADPLRLIVWTPSQVVLEADPVDWVHLELADDKRVTVWPGHLPMLAETMPGPVRYADRAGEHAEELPAGIVAVQERTVTLFLAGVVGEQVQEPKVARFGRLSEALVGQLAAKERTEERAADPA
jgi:F0F1-type ATP synthase epsilon subunit